MTPSHLEKLAREYVEAHNANGWEEHFRLYENSKIAGWIDGDPIATNAFISGCGAVLAEALPLMRDAVGLLCMDGNRHLYVALEAFIEKWGDGE